VTDRRRLVPVGSSFETERSALLRLTEQAVVAGIDVIQLRERDLEGRALAELAEAMVARLAGSRIRLLVNDRVDVALAAGAHGVHLRTDSLPARAVRRIVPPGFVIGRSIHRVDEAAIDDVDYLLAGTVWPTASKPEKWPTLEEDGLRAIVQAASLPVIAIGGVTLDRVPSVAAAGAAGCAAIGWFASASTERPDRSGLVDAVLAARSAYKTGPQE